VTRAQSGAPDPAGSAAGATTITSFVQRLDARGFAERANILLPGLYAWLLTVAEPATTPGASLLARVLAFLALLALVTGPLLAPDRPLLGRIFGIHAFVGFSVLAWSQLGAAVAPDQLDPLRAALGAFGWVFYAFGWGKTRGRGRVPEDDPNVLPGPSLAGRGRLSAAAWVVVAIAVLGAFVPTLFAWRVDRPDHAVLGHATTLAAGAAVLSSGATLALGFGQPRTVRSPTGRLNSAAAVLAALAVLAVIGLLWLALG
jgi:hypothetical protein